MLSLLKLVVIFLTVLKSQIRAQNVSFELLNNKVNEVIFVGEKDIMLNCSVITCVKNAVITIKRGQSVMTRSALNDRYLEYNITEVLQGDNGEYTCTVTYFDVNTGLNNTEMETLHLNFKEDRPQCFRNGTEGEPFEAGDVLLMSCYCLEEDDDCVWTSTNVRTRTSMPLESVFETISYRGKKIQRIKKEYTLFTDMDIRYDCFRSIGQAVFCSIGPQMKSSEDPIINMALRHNVVPTDQTECSLFQTSTIPSTNKSTTIALNLPTQNEVISTTASNPGTINVSIIGGIAGGICIFMLLILVIVCIVLKHGRRNTETKDPTVSEGHMYSNAAFVGHNGKKDDLDSKNHNSKSEMSSDYDLPPMGKNHRDKPSMQDDYADVKKSGNRHVVYDFPPESQDDYSYTERNGPSSNEAVSPISQSSQTTATRGDESSTHGNDSDLGYLYSQADKSGMPRGEHGKDRDLEHNEGEEEFAQLYAKVDKNRRSHTKDSSEKKVELNNVNGDLYAEIDQR